MNGFSLFTQHSPVSRACVDVLRVLLVIAFLNGHGAWARDLAAPYGARVVRDGVSWADGEVRGGRGPELRPASAPAAAGGDMQRRIVDLEAAAGPYAPGLEEPLAELGRSLAAEGRWQEAVAAYRRGLHVLRVNDGLYSPAQGALVAALLGVYRAAGDLEQLDGQYDYYFRLHGAGRQPLTPARLYAALGYLRWQREALRRELPGNEEDRLLELYRLNEDLLERVRADPAADYAALEALTMSQLRNLYLLEDRVAPEAETYVASARQPFPPPAFAETDPQLDRLLALQRTALAEGRELLQALLPRAPGAAERAGLLRELGDWYQWHGIGGRAVEHYRDAIAALEDAARQELVAAWWGEPVELPDNGAFWQAPEDEPAALALARYEVSAAGRARRPDVKVLQGTDGKAIVLGRTLRELRFRPRFAAGEPVDSPLLERRYRIYD
jgi:hypothetical protein